jgi:hypothetical protein
MNLAETAQAIRKRKQSAVETVRTSLDAISRLDGTFHAFIRVEAERALEQARRIDEAVAKGHPVGPLAGVPLAVKDNFCTTFGTTTCASRILANFKAPYDAHVIELLERAGAIVVGKTNLDEFAMGGSTENSGLFPTRPGFPAARPVARRRPWPCEWCRERWAVTRGAPFASRRPSAVSWASSPRTGLCRGMGWSRSPAAWTRSGRLRERPRTPRSCCR